MSRPHFEKELVALRMRTDTVSVIGIFVSPVTSRREITHKVSVIVICDGTESDQVF